VLSRDFEGSRIQWNPVFWDFSAYRGFRPRLCRPYRAQTKGKVEAGVKYVKRFLRGKAFDSPDRKPAGVEPRGGRQKQPLLQRLPR
jgi:transposase